MVPGLHVCRPGSHAYVGRDLRQAVGARVTTDLKHHAGFDAVQALPGVGPVLAAVFVTEIADVTRSPNPRQL